MFCPDDGTEMKPRKEAIIKEMAHDWDCPTCKGFWILVRVAGSTGIVNVKT